MSLVDKPFGSKAEKVYCAGCYDAAFASRCDGCSEVFRAGKYEDGKKLLEVFWSRTHVRRFLAGTLGGNCVPRTGLDICLPGSGFARTFRVGSAWPTHGRISEKISGDSILIVREFEALFKFPAILSFR